MADYIRLGDCGAGESQRHYLEDEGAMQVDKSREASLEMADNPAHNSDTPTGATSLVSMFQTNSVVDPRGAVHQLVSSPRVRNCHPDRRDMGRPMLPIPPDLITSPQHNDLRHTTIQGGRNEEIWLHGPLHAGG
ncbi:hypothetical protein [Paracoccus mutanolyticus]|uniref:hypothetical protein n=1 Tax=Paracoccus mutanolyticus TaxID=1499308 RepID=UPI001CB8F5BC|nr:hypothetical protein [Paracoccus mutanolyticus]